MFFFSCCTNKKDVDKPPKTSKKEEQRKKEPQKPKIQPPPVFQDQSEIKIQGPQTKNQLAPQPFVPKTQFVNQSKINIQVSGQSNQSNKLTINLLKTERQADGDIGQLPQIIEQVQPPCFFYDVYDVFDFKEPKPYTILRVNKKQLSNQSGNEPEQEALRTTVSKVRSCYTNDQLDLVKGNKDMMEKLAAKYPENQNLKARSWVK